MRWLCAPPRILRTCCTACTNQRPAVDPVWERQGGLYHRVGNRPQRPSRPYVTAIASASPAIGIRNSLNGSFRANRTAKPSRFALSYVTQPCEVEKQLSVVSSQQSGAGSATKITNAVIPSERPVFGRGSRDLLFAVPELVAQDDTSCVLRRQRPRLRLRLLLALAILACISFTHDQRDGHGHHGVVMRSGGRRALSILVTDEAATVLQQPLAVEQPG